MDVLWPIPLLLLSHCLALPVSSSFWYWQNYDVLNCDGRWAVTIVPLLWILLFESRSIFKKMRISTCKYFRSWKLSSLTIGVKFDEPERTARAGVQNFLIFWRARCRRCGHSSTIASFTPIRDIPAFFQSDRYVKLWLGETQSAVLLWLWKNGKSMPTPITRAWNF